MRRILRLFHQFANVLLCGAVLCAIGSAASLTSANAVAGANSCTQAGTITAACSASAPGNTLSGPIHAAASADALWATGGVLDATASATGFFTSAAAAVNFSNDVIVTGASGSGAVTISFFALQDILTMSPATGTVSPVTISLNGVANVFNIGGGGNFSFTWDVPFGVFLPLTVSFNDSAVGTMFMNETYGTGEADERLLAPSFTVSTVTGLPIPGGTVQFVPEPATFGLFLGVIPALWMARKRARRARA